MPGHEILRPLLADLLRSGTSVRLEVTGHSMSPFIRHGDVVALEPLRGRLPALGEVVALTPGGRLLVHRVVGWQRGQVLCRGDVAKGADPAVSPDDVLGRVTRVERRGRHVRLGLGIERLAIAWLSRVGLLRALAAVRQGLATRGSSTGGTRS
jgi:signal peptidase I